MKVRFKLKKTGEELTIHMDYVPREGEWINFGVDSATTDEHRIFQVIHTPVATEFQAYCVVK